MSQRKFIIDGGFQSNHDSIIDAGLQINGNLVVNGTTTEVNKTTMNVTTNSVFLNAGATGAPTQDAFLSVVRGNETNVSIRWNETSNQWEFTNDGVNFDAMGAGSYNDSLAVMAVDEAGYALETWVTDMIAISTAADRQWVADQSYATTAGLASEVSTINSTLATKANITYVNSEIQTAIDNLVDGAPGALDTLNELAAALNDDATLSSTVTNQLATKADTSYVDSQIANIDMSTKADITYVDNEIANAKMVTGQHIFNQVAEPIGTTENDIWINPSNGNMYSLNALATTGSTDSHTFSSPATILVFNDARGAYPYDYNTQRLHVTYWDDTTEEIAYSTSTIPRNVSITNVKSIVKDETYSPGYYFNVSYIEGEMWDLVNTSADITSAEVDAKIVGLDNWTEVTANSPLSMGSKYIVDTSATAITLTLPADGSGQAMGHTIRIMDGTGNASTNNITVTGGTIEGSTDNMVIATDRASFELVWYNATQGWILMEI